MAYLKKLRDSMYNPNFKDYFPANTTLDEWACKQIQMTNVVP